MGRHHRAWPVVLLVFASIAASGLLGWHLADRSDQIVWPYPTPWKLIMRR
jgi:hypothetical protein